MECKPIVSSLILAVGIAAGAALLGNQIGSGIEAACQSSCIRTKLVRADGKEYLIAFNYADGPAQADFRWGTHTRHIALDPHDVKILSLES